MGAEKNGRNQDMAELRGQGDEFVLPGGILKKPLKSFEQDSEIRFAD